MRFPLFTLLVVLASANAVHAQAPPADAKDWAMYNYDVLGSRHNVGERALGRENVGQLEEKWRFPAKAAKESVGAIHATPVVVNGHVYFGTATLPAVYKLAPDGSVKWIYRNPDHAKLGSAPGSGYSLPKSGFLNSALVTGDTVFVNDIAGTIYALDRMTGKERWKIDTRNSPFPGAHSSNCIFSAPVLADGKILIAGGGFEHGVGANPANKCCTGRGFVVALEPRTGAVVWKYDVGPVPKPLDPPLRIRDDWGEHVFYFGPSTSSVWCTPSYDAESQTVFFGTDTHNAPRQPTKDDPKLYTKHSCAIIAVDARTGQEKWVTQINPDDVWNYALRAYDPKTGRYKDQSIGDTPKIYTIERDGKPVKAVGAGCKNGGFYVLNAASGELLAQTPVYTGPPTSPPKNVNPRTLALPGVIGGLQTGCATDGKAVFTNGIDCLVRMNSANRLINMMPPPTAGRVVSISLDTRTENWRHERPKVKAVGGTPEKPLFTNVGDPVGSGIALAHGVAFFTTTVSNKLVALDTVSGKVLKEIDLGPVWCGPSVSRGRVYSGSGNILFVPAAMEGYYPKSNSGVLYSFGLPGDDEVSRMGKGTE
jgi:glucose dehydrogenase